MIFKVDLLSAFWYFGLEFNFSAIFAKVIVEQKVGQPHILQGKLGGKRSELEFQKCTIPYLHMYA